MGLKKKKPATLNKRNAPSDPINSTGDLASYLSDGCKPAADWSVGLELELFGFVREGLRRIDPDQVQAVMRGFDSETIDSVSEEGFVTEATVRFEPDGNSASGRITLEPGGQVEFSGSQQQSLQPTEDGLKLYLARLRVIADRLGLIFVASGFDPIRRAVEQKWIPKTRYQIMRPYLMRRGRRAWDMMCRTAAIQANLDHGDLEDLAKKFVLANRLGPIAAAIFANSPLEEGKLSGFKSVRYAVWLETDPDRTGLSPAAIDGSFSIERFLDYVSTVPMFFIRRGGAYIDLAGFSFGEFLAGHGGHHKPIIQDFGDHLSTLFTESRLKPHIEQRSIDSGSAEATMAALAFWKGLMYHAPTLDQALQLAPKLCVADFAALQLQVARHGLEARIGALSVLDVARSAIELAIQGLRAIAPDETRYLDPLEERVIREQLCPADILIRNLNGSWHGDVLRAVEYLRVA
jgi:glutamate--cysteine ligase